MKKIYVKPTLEVYDIQTNVLICASENAGLNGTQVDNDASLSPEGSFDFDFDE